MLIESLMRTRRVVIVDIFLEHMDEIPLIQNQRAVKAFLAN